MHEKQNGRHHIAGGGGGDKGVHYLAQSHTANVAWQVYLCWLQYQVPG